MSDTPLHHCLCNNCQALRRAISTTHKVLKANMEHSLFLSDGFAQQCLTLAASNDRNAILSRALEVLSKEEGTGRIEFVRTVAAQALAEAKAVMPLEYAKLRDAAPEEAPK
jgi:hypothetical protein